MKIYRKKTTFSAPSPRLRAEFMLFAATFFWGWTFPVVRDAVSLMPVFAFLSLRFALAAIFMCLLIRRLPPVSSWGFGTSLGFILFAAFALQTWGLVYTSSANSGFITGLNVVWVFMLSPGSWKKAWPQALLAISGLWLLTSPDTQAINPGDWLTLACSLFIAIHILMLAKMDIHRSSGDLAFVQFIIVAGASFAASLAFEPYVIPPAFSGELIFALLLTAGGATVFSFWAQTHFQRRTTALRAGLIFICEPLFAAAFAVLLYGESMPPSAWPGAALMLAAMVWTILKEEK